MMLIIYYPFQIVSVIVHYRAWTESTQHKFEDTWEEQRPLELVLGKGICAYGPDSLLKIYVIST